MLPKHRMGRFLSAMLLYFAAGWIFARLLPMTAAHPLPIALFFVTTGFLLHPRLWPWR